MPLSDGYVTGAPAVIPGMSGIAQQYVFVGVLVLQHVDGFETVNDMTDTVR